MIDRDKALQTFEGIPDDAAHHRGARTTTEYTNMEPDGCELCHLGYCTQTVRKIRGTDDLLVVHGMTLH